MTDRFLFYKDLYFKEVDRTYTLLNLSAVPTTIITGIFTGIYFLADKICSFSITNRIAFYGVALMVFLSFLSLLMALYYFIRYFFDKPQHLLSAKYDGVKLYKGYGDLEGWESYYLELKEYHKGNIQKVDYDFCEDLTSQTATIAWHNTQVNDRRAIYFYSTIQFCFVSLLFLLFSSPVFLYLNNTQHKDAIVCNVTNHPPNFSIMSKTTNATETAPPQLPPVPKDSPESKPPPQRPKPPPPREWGTPTKKQ
jgi:hypothetical protein